MEHNSENEQNLPSTLCRTGCGFYASAAFEGMCSKCYKDSVKRRNQNSSPTPTCLGGRASPSSSSSMTMTSVASSLVSEAAASVITTSSASTNAVNALSTASSLLATVDTSKTPDIQTATPTVPSTSTSQDKEDDSQASTEKSTEGATALASASDSNNDRDKKPKKNRCHSCKKKVGLTGFQCRCGGLYCSMHRYSDKHDCTFNYKELAQQQIRKNNPVVVGQKIQKI